MSRLQLFLHASVPWFLSRGVLYKIIVGGELVQFKLRRMGLEQLSGG